MTTSEEIEGWRTGLDALHGRIAGRFRRSEARERAKRYLAGLLDRVERKKGWQMAEHLGESGPQGVQRLLVWGKEVLADATRVPGNASMDSLVPRLAEVVDGHLVQLFDDSANQRDSKPALTGDMPPMLHPKSACTDPADQDEEKRWNLLAECRLDPQRPASGPYQRISDRKVSRTDPDACAMSMRDGRTVAGYQDHYLVDGGKARIILHAFVTPGDVAENNVLLDQLRRTIFRRKLRPKRVIADAKYASADNIRALEDEGIRAYVRLPEWDKSSPYFHIAAFTYDADEDVYRCPQGQVLKLEWIDEVGERNVYRARAATCNACPVKEQCTRSNQGRLIGPSFHAPYVERVRSYQETRAYQRAMRKRRVWIEPLFAEAKQWHGLNRFRLRWLANVNIEALVVASGQNLKRWL